MVQKFWPLLSLALLLWWPDAYAGAAGRQQLQGHVPKAIATAPRIGPLDPSVQLKLVLSLPLRNHAELQELLKQLYDPRSPQYHHFLTQGQFEERFGPAEKDYQALISFARSNHLNIIATRPSHLVLEIQGRVDEIQKIFQVRLGQYQRTDGSLFFAPENEPSIDLDVPVLHISGLDNYQRPRPAVHVKGIHSWAAGNVSGNVFPLARRTATPTPTSGTATPTPTPGTGSAPSGLFWGKDFRNAYVPGVCLTGTGQSVALVEFEGYYANDIQGYENLAGLPNVTLTNVPLSGFTLDTTDSDGIVEVSLDIEMAISMAPGLSQVRVYELSDTSTNAEADMLLDQIYSDGATISINQISCSWTGFGDAATSNYFEDFASRGQAFFQAAGDDGAYVEGDPTPTVPSPINLNSNIQMTVVGGTELTMNGAGQSYLSETTWNAPLSGVTYASGGGICSEVSIPSYQQTVPMTANGGSTVLRNIPDVSMVADNVFVIADNDYVSNNNYSYYSVVGTSCAAPLWAGFYSLASQQAAEGGVTLGFANPLVYPVGLGGNYTSDFNDITTGNNNLDGNSELYSAMTGYDLATGWGSPKGQNLINALTNSTPVGCTITPTITLTPTNTPKNSPTQTTTNTATNSATHSPTPTTTTTPTFTPTFTVSVTPTFTPSATSTASPTNTPSNTSTKTPISTLTNTITNTPSGTPTITQTNTSSSTPTLSPTVTPSNTATSTSSGTPTNLPTGTSTDTPTESPSNTLTATPIFTSTNTITNTPSGTLTSTQTNTSTSTPTLSSTNTPVNTPTNTASGTSTPLPTSTSTVTPTNTPSQTLTITPISTSTNTMTNTPSDTATSTQTNTVSLTQTPSPTNTTSFTPTSTASGTSTPLPTASPTDTPSNTLTGTPIPTSTATVTNTPSSTPTSTQTNIASATPTLSSTNSPSNTVTSTSSGTPTNIPTQTPTATPTDTPSSTLTPTPISTSTNTMTNTPSYTVTNTQTDTASSTSSSTATATPINTATNTSTSTVTITPTSIPTQTATNTFFNPFIETPTNTPTSTPVSSSTNTPTSTETNTLTATLTGTSSGSTGFALTATQTSTPTPTPTDTSTSSSTATITLTAISSFTQTATVSGTPMATETPTPTSTPNTVPILARPTPGWWVAPNFSHGGEPINWQVVLTSPSEIIVGLYDVAGELVFKTSVQGNVGLNTISWKLQNQSGQRVSNGLYIYYIQIPQGFSLRNPYGKVMVIN